MSVRQDELIAATAARWGMAYHVKLVVRPDGETYTIVTFHNVTDAFWEAWHAEKNFLWQMGFSVKLEQVTSVWGRIQKHWRVEWWLVLGRNWPFEANDLDHFCRLVGLDFERERRRRRRRQRRADDFIWNEPPVVSPLHELLKLPAKTPYAQMRAAYRALLKRVHPDVNKAPDAEQRTKALIDAWEKYRKEHEIQ